MEPITRKKTLLYQHRRRVRIFLLFSGKTKEREGREGYPERR
jgi:hypothetical protein